ncbi:MAG: RNA-binding S4 domain-containing protein [Paludibacteraceae bacterium]|nr:RNA-binding S4 domain-containing protein [Paludibacteraceae bacterium]MDY4851173.1 RNA-binding S4 domain-containing protein [Paludibacteraceae bacterium]
MECRVDKWLWAVRVFKTRSLAADACKKGRVLMQDVAVKPSRELKVGDVLQVRRNPIIYTFKVVALTQNRVGAKLVPQFMENVTAPDQLELLEVLKLDQSNRRAKGLGRPTKKERRDLDDFFDDAICYFDDEDELD